MRARVLALAVALAAFGCGGGAPARSAASAGEGKLSAQLVDPYLKIHAALAKDSLDGLKASAGEVATAATGLGAAASKIDTAAVQLASAGDLKTAREKFGDLSEAIDQYASAGKLSLPQDVRKAYCPMANKPWLQKGSEISNPYYGKEMPTCGEFK